MNPEVKISTDQKEVTILTGKALDPRPPRSIDIIGTLQAPFQWWEGKKDKIKPLDAHILIENHKGSITLNIDEYNGNTTTVIQGVLSEDDNLKSFMINTDKRWSIREFLKFIKTMRFFFADKAAHSTLIQAIQKWSVKIERVINDHNDNKGNSNFQLETKVHETEGFISKFDLLIPLFQGYPKVKFTVEIGLDPKNTEVQLYLFSDELIELTIQQRESIMKSEIDKFSEFPCSKVVVS